MKWILVPLVAMVALVLLIVIIGLTLPIAHVASRKARFRQSPQAVFDAISGPGEWRSDLSKIEPLPAINGKPQWKEISKRGDAITYELVDSTPPLRRVTRITDDTLPFGGTWTLEIAPVVGGSTLRIIENGEVRNPIFRFVSRFIMGHHKTIDTYLGDLAKKFNEPLVLEK